jgi:hypothetical protein
MQVIAIYIRSFARKPKIKEKSEKWIAEFLNKLIKRKKLVEKITRKGHYRDARICEDYIAMSSEVLKMVERRLRYTLGDLYPFAEIGECVFVQIIYDELEYHGHHISANTAQEHQIIGKGNAVYFVIQKAKNHAVLVKISTSELIKYLYHQHVLTVKKAKRVVRAIERKIRLGKKETFPSSIFFSLWCLMKFEPFFFTPDDQEQGRYLIIEPKKNDIITVKMISDYGEITFVLQVLKVQKDCFVARYIPVEIAALLQN